MLLCASFNEENCPFPTHRTQIVGLLWVMVVLLDLFTQNVWSPARATIMFLITSLQGPSLLILSAGQPAAGRLLVVLFFHLRIMEATVVLATISTAECFHSLPQVCASTQSCLWALQAVPLTSWLGFYSDVHCQLWDYTQTGVCAFPYHIQLDEFTTGGLQSRGFKDHQEKWEGPEHSF